MKNIITSLHDPLLISRGFSCVESMEKQNSKEMRYQLNPEMGTGQFWYYLEKNLFSIVIHDFTFYEDFILECQLPDYLSITYYHSISGEELNPYRRLSAGRVRSCIGCQTTYKALFHKNIPIQSVGIEITPEYYEDYLRKKFPDEYIDVKNSLINMGDAIHFHEMVLLLNQIRNFRGTGVAARLFYEGKVAEAVSLVVEKARFLGEKALVKVSNQDLRNIEVVTAYMNDHFAGDLKLEQLSQIACMGTTKLKTTFKAVNKCTITEYIQHRRISQAEQLLTNTDLSIGQIAQIIGYSSASRFSELFRKNTGQLPMEYRKLSSSSGNCF
ncbi:helix-turn-helix domain-containing protein [Anaeromicropila populeti]|uniref:Helix-turn-helix domain-containing protein n=1 Tax=Anaeromicropila populeti TaxID=37658 RepID=A0A1I6JXA2_9FIRM|nr:AraC family transcriptional regulator [Anaeromicropila populeti]SFR83602.1 Helix-turn-helix domain-containing protein [Anaeromicropila populeti]